MIAQAGLFLLEVLTGFLSLALLLRFYMQAFRVSFNNPAGSFVVEATNWLVRPLRKALPGLLGLDLASLVPAYLLQCLFLFVVVWLGSADSKGVTGQCFDLAGGMIRGGYYGDVGIAGDDGDGHVYSYSAPRIDNGQPMAAVTDGSGRLAGKYIWRTVAKALGIPDSEASQFPDVADAAPLSWLLA